MRLFKAKPKKSILVELTPEQGELLHECHVHGITTADKLKEVVELSRV